MEINGLIDPGKGNGPQMQGSATLGRIANGGGGTGTTIIISTVGEARFIVMGGMGINYLITPPIGPLIRLLFLTTPIRHILTMGNGILGAGHLMSPLTAILQATIVAHLSGLSTGSVT